MTKSQGGMTKPVKKSSTLNPQGALSNAAKSARKNSMAAPQSISSNATKKSPANSIKMYLDTSTPTCRLRLNSQEYTWEAGRELAEGLHAFIRDRLAENNATWQDLSEITYFSGPGSFTGLRIGAAVVNTLADQLNIPLYNHHGEQVPVILPDYGRPARITQPKK